MDPAAYRSLLDSQDRHWWFVGRRRIVSGLIERFVTRPTVVRILEAGCGYGGNLAMLETFGDTYAFEFDSDARVHATSLASRPVAFGCLPDNIGFADESFDLVAILDVLEHIDDDVASLRTLSERLSVGGSLVITVPAVPWLWSDHDVLHHHKRRYTKAMLRERLSEAGLKVNKIAYFNSLLFPFAVAQRLISRFTGGKLADYDVPNKYLNALMLAIFTLEAKLLGRIHFPIGLSLYVVAQKAHA